MHNTTCTQCMTDLFYVAYKEVFVELEGAVLSSQKVIQFPFPFGFEEDVKENRNHTEEAGHSHCSDHQPCECGVCKEGDEGK